jgi:hypothetical protein
MAIHGAHRADRPGTGRQGGHWPQYTGAVASR